MKNYLVYFNVEETWRHFVDKTSKYEVVPATCKAEAKAIIIIKYKIPNYDILSVEEFTYEIALDYGHPGYKHGIEKW